MKALAATLLAIGRTRLELLSTEIEEERLRISALLVWTLVALFCAALGVALATLFVVVFFWDTHRLLALGTLTLLFLFVAALACAVVIGKAKAKPRPFAASLAELSKDCEQLSSRS